jgi:hypothetical protein
MGFRKICGYLIGKHEGNRMKYLEYKTIQAASDNKGALSSFEVGSLYRIACVNCTAIAPGVYTVIAKLEKIEETSATLSEPKEQGNGV